MRRVVIDHVNSRISTEVSPQIPRERRIELEKKQLTIRPHAARDLARMNAFARPVLGDHLRSVEIDLVGHPLDQRL